MKSLPKFILVIFALFLTSCKSTSDISIPEVAQIKPYLDSLYPKHHYIKIETEQDIFALDDSMKLMVDKVIRPEKDARVKALTLLDYIFNTENLNIDYQSNANLTAKQTFHSATANCMSLTIMAYSLAKYANLEVDFQEVQIPEYWVRNKSFNMLTGHVNLVMANKPRNDTKRVFRDNLIQIDFDPYIVKKHFPKKIISKNTVMAMFYNNKGAQALVEQDHVRAYAYFKAATKVAPRFSYGWGNLGILYRLANQNELAEYAYLKAIKLNKRNLTALTNLAILYRIDNRSNKAKRIENTLLSYRNKNPYYFALLADEAAYVGNTKVAIKQYKKAIKLDKKIHEFYYNLSKVYYQSGQMKLAKQAIAKAISLNKLNSVNNLYTAKLNFLNKSQ